MVVRRLKYVYFNKLFDVFMNSYEIQNCWDNYSDREKINFLSVEKTVLKFSTLMINIKKYNKFNIN